MCGPLACWHQQRVVLLSLPVGLMVSLLASLLPICSDTLLCIDGNFSATRNKSPNSACLNGREDFLSPIIRSPKVGGKPQVFWQSFHNGLSFSLFFSMVAMWSEYHIQIWVSSRRQGFLSFLLPCFLLSFPSLPSLSPSFLGKRKPFLILPWTSHQVSLAGTMSQSSQSLADEMEQCNWFRPCIICFLGGELGSTSFEAHGYVRRE